MLTHIRWCALVLAVVGLAPGPDDATAARVYRAGQVAFHRGDYATAVRLFAEVEPVASDPGQVTFALAAAHFRLALGTGEDAARHLSEAATLFRCLLEPGEPRRAEATLGLGCALLVRAARGRDHGACGAALRLLEQCAALKAGAASDEAARLLHRARLLEWQLMPTPLTQQEQPDPVPPEQSPKEKDPQGGPKDKGDNNKQGSTTKPTPVNNPKEKPEAVKDGPQAMQAGKGTNEQKSDHGKLPPAFSPEEALREVRLANKLIQAEQKAFRRSIARPAAEGVPDW